MRWAVYVFNFSKHHTKCKPFARVFIMWNSVGDSCYIIEIKCLTEIPSEHLKNIYYINCPWYDMVAL